MTAKLIPLLFRWRKAVTKPERPKARRRRRLPMRPLAAGDEVLYLGQGYRLAITHDPAQRQSCQLAGEQIIVNLPQKNLSAKAMLEEIRLELRLWYRKQARNYIQPRLSHWAGILGLKYTRCLITGPVSLWGSCNAKNEIRINWRIMMADPGLIDYLLAHELCHVAHKNHSPRFWSLLAGVMPDCKHRRQQLRASGPQLFSQQG